MANNLQKLRKQVDQIDKKLLKILAERFKITKKIGELKSKRSLPACDKKREILLFKERESLAKKLGLNKGLAKNIFNEIIKTVKKDHKKIKERRTKNKEQEK